jgi:hypothetical protein
MDQTAQALAEEAIAALGRHDSSSARTAISQAVSIDRHIAPLADIVYLACSELDDDGSVPTATWNALADAVDAGHLLSVVEATRTS